MKIRSILMLTCFAIVPFFTMAQTDATGEYEMQDVSLLSGKYAVGTKRFFSDWFVGVDGGVQTYVGRQQSFGKISPSVSAFVGKWFIPTIGVRLLGSGWNVKTADSNIGYYNLQGDLMFNLSNAITGYKADRIYNAIPYVGVGWTGLSKDKRAGEVCGAVGFLNSWRVHKSWDVNVDIRGTFNRDAFFKDTEHVAGLLSAGVGVTYHIPSIEELRKWDQSLAYTVYNTPRETTMRETIKGREGENKELQRAIAEARAKASDRLRVSALGVPSLLVTFAEGSDKVQDEDRVNLGYFAYIVKAGNPKVVYSITGYADAETEASNGKDLSERRAKAIRDCLISEFGVRKEQLVYEGKGAVKAMFYENTTLSRAAIVESIKE